MRKAKERKAIKSDFVMQKKMGFNQVLSYNLSSHSEWGDTQPAFPKGFADVCGAVAYINIQEPSKAIDNGGCKLC